MTETGERTLSGIFTMIIFALLIISPIVISKRYNERMKVFYVQDEVKDYLEIVVVEDLTASNYTAFLNVMAAVDMDVELVVVKDGDFYTMGEVLDTIKTTGKMGLGLGDFVEITARDKELVVYDSQVIGAN